MVLNSNHFECWNLLYKIWVQLMLIDRSRFHRHNEMVEQRFHFWTEFRWWFSMLDAWSRLFKYEITTTTKSAPNIIWNLFHFQPDRWPKIPHHELYMLLCLCCSRSENCFMCKCKCMFRIDYRNLGGLGLYGCVVIQTQLHISFIIGHIIGRPSFEWTERINERERFTWAIMEALNVFASQFSIHKWILNNMVFDDYDSHINTIER